MGNELCLRGMAIRSMPQAKSYRTKIKAHTPEEWERALKKPSLRELLEELAKDDDPEIAAAAKARLAKLPPSDP